MTKFTKIFLVVAVIVLVQAAAYAQTTGTLSGIVTDPNGAPIAGANVSIKGADTGTARSAVTTDRGIFSFNLVPPGAYVVTVENSGFKKWVNPSVPVQVSIENQLTIQLEIGLASETVTVTSGQDIVNTSSPTLTNVIDTRQVADLPLPTRNPLDLAALQAGIAVVGTDTRNASVGGLRGSTTNVTQDGINAMDNFVKTSSFFAINAPSLNSTSEFSITTGTTGSDAGRGVAQVNLVTKSGTNELHGGVFYLHRNDWLNANSFFNNQTAGGATPRARQRQHFFGFDIGGPMFLPGIGEGWKALWDGRDTAHWFFSYEGFRENFSATRNRTVLTQEARNGIFRYNVGGVTQSVNLLSIGNVGVTNPLTMALINATPLPNNVEVGDTLNTAGYRFGVGGSDVNDKYVFRYDHHITKRSRLGAHKIEFVYQTADFSLNPDTFNGLEAPFPGGDNAFQASKRSLLTGALVSQFGNISNVFRFGRQWAPVEFTRDSNPSAPFIILGSISNIANTFMSQGRETIVKQFSDNMVIPKGNHVFRFGTDIQGIFADTFNDAGINQTINIGSNSANPTGILPAELPGASSTQQSLAGAIYANLVGNLANSSATFNVRSATSGFVPGFTRERLFHQDDVALYFQDQWRVRPNLSLNLGVRWEYEGVPTIPNGLAIQPKYSDLFGVSGFGNLFRPNAPAGAAPAVATLNFVDGDTGIPLYNQDWNNFAPFIGIAWSPNFKGGVGRAMFGEFGKSSFRLGYSISYTRDGFTVISNAMGTGTTNPGLIQSAANTTPTGVLTAAGVPLVTPTFVMPVTDRQNNLLNPNNGLWTIDPDIVVPYVQQWNIGYEREIFKDTAIEIRYQGNHAVKLWRAVNYNEVNIFENGFLTEFNNARLNLAARGGTSFAPGCAGCVALPIFDRFFAGLTPTSTSGYASSGFITNLNNGAVGSMANTLAFSNTYRAARENPLNNIPANFFVANPNALNSIGLSNDSMSNYHALQVEFRRRLSAGLQFQADYTWSKAMNDAVGNQTSQSDLYSWWTLRNKRFDYMPSNQDQRHRFTANAIYDLPFGRGKAFFGNANGFVDRLIGGWTVSTIVTWATRPPFYVGAANATFNQFAGAAQLIGMTFEEFRKNVGFYERPEGNYWINPDLLNITLNAQGRYSGSTLRPGILGDPAPGQWGNFPFNSLLGPNYFNVDAGLVKRVPITERVRGELKTTFINILNHPNFAAGTQAWNSTTFGRISGTSGSVRIIHFTAGIRF